MTTPDPKVTTREELIEQAARTIYEANPERTGFMSGNEEVAWEDVETKLSKLTRKLYLQTGEAVVNAGWRPAPSGEVVEQAGKVLGQAFASLLGSGPEQAFDEYWRAKAQALADAGLLRAIGEVTPE